MERGAWQTTVHGVRKSWTHTHIQIWEFHCVTKCAPHYKSLINREAYFSITLNLGSRQSVAPQSSRFQPPIFLLYYSQPVASLQMGSMTIKCVGSGPRLPGLKSRLYRLLAPWSWVSHLTSQLLSYSSIIMLLHSIIRRMMWINADKGLRTVPAQ